MKYGSCIHFFDLRIPNQHLKYMSSNILVFSLKAQILSELYVNHLKQFWLYIHFIFGIQFSILNNKKRSQYLVKLCLHSKILISQHQHFGLYYKTSTQKQMINKITFKNIVLRLTFDCFTVNSKSIFPQNNCNIAFYIMPITYVKLYRNWI